MKFKKKKVPRRKFVKIFFRLIQILLSERHTQKNTASLYRSLMLCFWKTISKLTCSLKMVPFPQFLSKSFNSSTHYFSFGPLYTNKITKTWKKIFCLNLSGWKIDEFDLGGSLIKIGKKNLSNFCYFIRVEQTKWKIMCAWINRLGQELRKWDHF